MLSRLLSRPKFWIIFIPVLILLVLGLVGGALGEEFFGQGFLTTPMHIEVAAEKLTGPLFSLGPLGGFHITNTMVATWGTILVVGVVAYLGTRRLSLVPRGLQNLLEIVIEAFLGLVEGVAGKERARRFFPLVMTIFLFIIISNWMGILPGYNTIGIVEEAHDVIEEKVVENQENPESVKLQLFDDAGGLKLLPITSGDKEITAKEVEEDHVPEGKTAGLLLPFFRSANTDLNTPLAIAIVAMFMVEFWGIRSMGFFSYGRRFVNVGRFFGGIRRFNFGEIFNGAIDAFTGVLEFISEVARVISFTFRLFGNIFAGEILVFVGLFLFPMLMLVFVFGFELFVGMIQAFIFAMLTLVFATMATSAHESGEEGH